MTEELENAENQETFDENEKKCKCKKDILLITVVTNAVATLLLAITMAVMVFGYILPAAGSAGFPNAKNQGHIFKGKTVSYEDAMKDKKKYAVVLFYADWCRHCQRFGPTYEKLSKDRKLKKKFNFVRINVESEQAAQLMPEFQVQGFPALFLVNPKDNERFFVNNNLLFGEDSNKILKDIFKSFADSRDKGLNVSEPNENKAEKE